MPGKALKELVTQKYRSSTLIQEGSGANPLMIGLWYAVNRSPTVADSESLHTETKARVTGSK